MAWRPGRRAQERALEAPYEDVPDHLAQPLWNWIEVSLAGDEYSDSDRTVQVGIDLRIPLTGERHNRVNALLIRARENSNFMLDLCEALLERYGWDRGNAERLGGLLDNANSNYGVKSDYSGLEMRITPEVKEQVQAVVHSAAGSAGDHLTNAWNEAYGRVHDPVKSYSESIKAVEAAIAQRVTPQNGRQTLGTMIRDVKAKPSKWTFPLPGGVESVLGMMEALWIGQTSRHGGVGTTRAETLDEAQAAVHLAATLVQFGISGAFDLA